MRLDAIVDFEMTELESRAYKLSILWLDRSREMFPNYNHGKIKNTKDPRKSFLFKLCYKLVQRTQGLLEPSEYSLYVRSQLEILKHIKNGQTHALIDPNCLVGDKAWVRWKLWKRKYDTRNQIVTHTDLGPSYNKITEGLKSTREFITKIFGATPNITDYQEALINKNLFKWIITGKISPYYLVMSPFISQIISHEELSTKINFDLLIYKNSITTESENKFFELFNYEK